MKGSEKVAHVSDPEAVTRLTRRAAYACDGLILATPVALAVAWTMLETPGASAPSGFPGNATDRIGGFVIAMLPAAIAMLALHRLGAVFRRLAAGGYFDVAVAELLRRCAVALLLYPVAQIVARAAMSLWATRDADAGERALAITLSGHDIPFLLFGVLLLVLAQVLRKAADLADDLRQIV